MPAKHDILVIGPSWVGDMVMAQSLFAALKQRYPVYRPAELLEIGTYSVVCTNPNSHRLAWRNALWIAE